MMRHSLFFLVLLLWLGAEGISTAQEGSSAVHRLPPIGTVEKESPTIQQVSGFEELPSPSFSEPPLQPPSMGPNDLIDPQLVQPRYDGESYFLQDWFSKAAWDPWEGNVELGLNGTDGNTETFNIRLGATAKYKTDWLERALQLTTIQKTANGVTTANTTLLDGRLDWPMKESPWNYFIHGLLEHDQFKAFYYRASIDSGFGYEFIQTDATALIGRAGLAASQEIGGVHGRFHPEFYFGGEFKHQVNEANKLSMKVDYYPGISNFSDFRLNSQFSWENVLSKAWGLSMKWSIIDRYDSTPQGAKPNDLDYSTLVIWAF